MKRSYLLAVIMLLILTACGGKKTYSYHPEYSSVFISRDGTLKSALVGEVDENAKGSELESFAKEEVEEFNNLDANNNVKLETSSIKDSKAKLIFSYNSFDSMQAFGKYTQDSSFDLESVAVFKLSDVDFTSMDAIDIPEGTKGNYIAIIQGSADIYTEGKITYVSRNLDFKDNNVKVDGFTYIIFE